MSQPLSIADVIRSYKIQVPLGVSMHKNIHRSKASTFTNIFDLYHFELSHVNESEEYQPKAIAGTFLSHGFDLEFLVNQVIELEESIQGEEAFKNTVVRFDLNFRSQVQNIQLSLENKGHSSKVRTEYSMEKGYRKFLMYFELSEFLDVVHHVHPELYKRMSASCQSQLFQEFFVKGPTILKDPEDFEDLDTSIFEGKY